MLRLNLDISQYFLILFGGGAEFPLYQLYVYLNYRNASMDKNIDS
jgi:hypothetical protein